MNEGTPIELKVRVTGFPQPDVKWYRYENLIEPDDDRIKIVQNPDGSCSLLIDDATPDDAGKYKAVVENDLGSIESQADIGVVPKEKADRRSETKPTVVSGLKDLEITETLPARLEAKILSSPQAQIQWFHNGEAVIPNDRIKTVEKPDGTVALVISNVELADSGDYQVVASNNLGTVASNAILSVISETAGKGKKPEFIRGLSDCQVQLGSLVRFKIEVAGSPEPKLKWLHENQEIVSRPGHVRISELPDGSASLLINESSQTDAGQYRVIATNEFGSVASTGILTITSKPKMVAGLKDVDVTEGSPVVFEAQAEGCPIPEFRWFLNGSEMKPDGLRVKIVESPGVSQLVIENASLKDAGDYRVIASNDSGSAPSTASLTVSKKVEKPAFVTGLKDQEIEIGSAIKLEIKVTGIPRPKISWVKDNEQIIQKPGVLRLSENPDEGSSVLTINSATPENAGNYKVIAKNEAGEAVTKG